MEGLIRLRIFQITPNRSMVFKGGDPSFYFPTENRPSLSGSIFLARPLLMGILRNHPKLHLNQHPLYYVFKPDPLSQLGNGSEVSKLCKFFFKEL